MAHVSICIPTYNNAEEVERLLQSILKQDYMDYEINISDDSTNQEIEKLVEKLRAQLQDINYYHNPKPLGHIYNWNAAIRMATGNLIKVMFSDDWFTMDSSLGELVALLEENPEADLAFSGSRQVMLDGDTSQVRHVTEEHVMASYDRCAEDSFLKELQKDYRFLFCGNQIGAPSASIYRRRDKLFLFDEKSNWASDMFLFFDILQQNPQFAYTKEPLISIGVHEHQYTESFGEKDMRIYNDYRYMYTKYGLQTSRTCREYFAGNYIVKYGTGRREAKKLGIEGSIYWRKWLAEQQMMISSFLRARIKKVRS